MPRFQKGEMPICGVRFEKGLVPWNKGKTGLFLHTAETKERIRLAMIGRKPWNFGLTHINTGYNHFPNRRKYCTTCELYYDKEQYDKFKNPFHCEDCGRKLRSLPRSRTDRVYI